MFLPVGGCHDENPVVVRRRHAIELKEKFRFNSSHAIMLPVFAGGQQRVYFVHEHDRRLQLLPGRIRREKEDIWTSNSPVKYGATGAF